MPGAAKVLFLNMTETNFIFQTGSTPFQKASFSANFCLLMLCRLYVMSALPYCRIVFLQHIFYNKVVFSELISPAVCNFLASTA